ncbi:MAG: SHOCT domain-containing protein [Nitrospinae bacterium]|nr:SHOCT domain-containing protein [Nitrospinota bacterium]
MPIFISCASAHINKEGEIKVRLEKIKSDDFSLKEKKELENILNSIFFSERTGFSNWGEEKQLFVAEESGKIANAVIKGLEAAKPDEMVIFEIKSANGETSVEVFVSESLNLRFNSVNGIPFSIEREATGLPPRGEYSYSSDNYKVIPHINHTYFLSKGIFGKEGKHLNWVIIANDKKEIPSAVTPPPQPTISTPQTKEGLTIQERLEVLKDLKEKGLISESDYERKKKEILDSL